MIHTDQNTIIFTINNTVDNTVIHKGKYSISYCIYVINCGL